MMDQGKKFLSDTKSAIPLIKDFTKGIESFEVYDKDLKTQSAVERQLGIIGEAVNKYEKLIDVKPFEKAGKIVGFRNRLIHAYDSIDNSMVWVILIRYLDDLEIEVLDRLKE